ncbi:CRP-like cAMP-binding protein [Kitasatospora viridis]|uniref:CRP-like cAMP-binding protein n=1 Tax=Kitasatospora viridis TaxID=281105 RepID=A0A561SDD5_9ACTN|nr:CRP-like cAMP-binding protein [Kitasatospora viridis]
MVFSTGEPRLSAAEVGRIRAGGRRASLDHGNVLTLEGTSADKVFLVTHGVVKVSSVSAAGGFKHLAIRGPGQLVGEFACIVGGTRSGTAVAVTDVSAWEIPADRFLHTLRSDPALCFAVLRIIVGRVRESDGRIGELGEFSASDRVVRLLARLGASCAEHDGPAAPVTVPVDQSELAGCAGVARETVSRTLTALARHGMAHGRRGRVVIDDLPALIRRAQETEGR